MDNLQSDNELIEGGDQLEKGIQETSLGGAARGLRTETAGVVPRPKSSSHSDRRDQVTLAETRAKLGALLRDNDHEASADREHALQKTLASLSQAIGTSVSEGTPPQRLQEIASFALDNLASNNGFGRDNAQAVAALLSASMASADRADLQASFAKGVGFNIAIDSPFEEREQILGTAFGALAHSPIGADGTRDLLAILAVGAAGRNNAEMIAFLSRGVMPNLRPESEPEAMSKLAGQAFDDLAYRLGRDTACDVLAMAAVTMFA